MKSSPARVASTIFGVRLHELPSERTVRAACATFLESGETRCVFTPNPEILLYARAHPDYAGLLNEGDLALPDGFGIVLVTGLRRRGALSRWAGVDVAGWVVRLAAERGARVMFLGGRGGAGERSAERWRAEVPGLDVVAVGDGIAFGEDGLARNPQQEAELGAQIQESRPAVVLVALGHPKQERWIGRNRRSISSARILMGVGGAFDIWSGRFRRAPRWVRSAGLEWLWRLVQEPRRLGRVLRATLAFPLLALVERVPRVGRPADL
jgi:N-acetylglucosaminyldiphosphoundecaprenol N-acetyl-beta-D-mannosaminyltransferase